MISYIDDKVGQLLQALDATGLRDSTMVLFTADHGEMLGERGLWYKMNFFEWSARVPLIFHAPGRFAPRRVAAHVSLVDLLPTLVELALTQGDDDPGPDLIPAVDGQSLVPLLQGNVTNWPNPVLAEMLAEGAVAPCLMIRRDRYKYIYSEPDPEQLYDLDTDPIELVNLADQPEYEEVRRAFKAEIRSRWRPRTLRQRIIESQRRRHLVTKALMSGHKQTSWDFQPYQDASKRYVRNQVNLDDLERRARFPSPPVPEPDFPPEQADDVSFTDQDDYESIAPGDHQC